jgi:FMN reductase
VVIASPAYHGGLSGLVKNALDFIEDLRGDERVYLQGRAVGSIVCAEGPQAMGSTLASLRAIVHTLRGWPTPYGATLNSGNKPFGIDGRGVDPAAVASCHTVTEEVVRFARMWRLAALAAAH